MSKTKTQYIRNSLAVTASALAMAVASMAAADAQTTVLPSGFSIVNIDTTLAASTKKLEISSGNSAYIVPSWLATGGAGWGGALAIGNNTALVMNPASMSTNNPCQNGSLAWNGAASCLFGGPAIQVDSGATLILAGTQTNSGIAQGYGFEDTIHADGDVVFEDEGIQSWDGAHALDQIVGTNYFGHNVTLSPNSIVTFGLDWAPGNTQFGSATNLNLGAGSTLRIYQSSASPLVMGGAISGSGTLLLGSGTLIVNGQNTAANPFLGTLTVTPGNMLVIGDGAHASAVFGDPGHPTAQTLTIKGTTGGAPTLRGTGTIQAVVSNQFGVVQPGYGTTLGSLTVAGYNQDSVGTLKVEVSPTSVSGLHVLGNAALGGSLNVAIDAGNYATQIYNIVQVDGTMTGDFTSITTSSAVQGAIAAVTRTDHGYQVVTQVVQGKAATAPIVVGHLVDINRLNNTYFVGSLYDRINVDSPRGGQQIGRNKYVWMEGFGRHSSVSRNDVGYHDTTAGFTAGAEYRTDANYVAGVAVSYSNGDMKAKGASTASMQAWTIAAYGGADVQYFRLDGAVFYNGYSTDTERAFGTPGTAKTSPSGYAFGGSAQVSLPLLRGLVTPYLRGIISRQHLDASAETGSPLLNLRYKAINGNYFVGDIGFRIDPLRSLPDSKTKLFVTLALSHDFSTLGEKVIGTFPVDNGQAWSSYWRGDSENTGVVGIDLAQRITDQLEIAGRVNGRFSLYQTSGELALNAKYKF